MKNKTKNNKEFFKIKKKENKKQDKKIIKNFSK